MCDYMGSAGEAVLDTRQGRAPRVLRLSTFEQGLLVLHRLHPDIVSPRATLVFL